MIFHRIQLLRVIFRNNDKVAVEYARRWQRAFASDPELAPDLIRLGGIMTMMPVHVRDGDIVPDPIDPLRLAHEQGMRDMALKLLALGGITPTELNKMMEKNNV